MSMCSGAMRIFKLISQFEEQLFCRVQWLFIKKILDIKEFVLLAFANVAENWPHQDNLFFTINQNQT